MPSTVGEDAHMQFVRLRLLPDAEQQKSMVHAKTSVIQQASSDSSAGTNLFISIVHDLLQILLKSCHLLCSLGCNACFLLARGLLLEPCSFCWRLCIQKGLNRHFYLCFVLLLKASLLVRQSLAGLRRHSAAMLSMYREKEIVCMRYMYARSICLFGYALLCTCQSSPMCHLVNH